MAKSKDEKETYREILVDDDDFDEDSEDDSDTFRENMKDKYHKGKEDFKEYADKARDKIHDKPIESVLIATGIGAIVGMTMVASAVGMRNMYESNNSKFSRAKKEVKGWPDSFEDEVKDKPLQALGIALGVGVLIGALMGKKDGNK